MEKRLPQKIGSKQGQVQTKSKPFLPHKFGESLRIVTGSAISNRRLPNQIHESALTATPIKKWLARKHAS